MAKETVKKEEKKVEVSYTPEQQGLHTHIQSLTRKINQHQFEIDELMPSLQAYQQALAESIKSQSDDISEDN